MFSTHLWQKKKISATHVHVLQKRIVVTGSGSFTIFLIVIQLNCHVMEAEVFCVDNKFKFMYVLIQKETKTRAPIQ